MLKTKGTSQQQQTADTLVRVVRKLTEEFHPRQVRTRPVTLDSSLEKDLGLDSLARMELLSRIESSFDLTLGERAFADAETARDLLRAILGAQPHATSASLERIQAAAGGGVEDYPSSARTLLEVLDWHLERHAERPHIRFYTGGREGRVLSYGKLHLGAAAVAGGLQQLGIAKGTPVALMLPTGADYFYSFIGVLLAGGVPVPIYPPTRKSQMEDHLRRQVAILDNCAASVLITMPEALLFGRLLKSRLKALRHLVTVARLRSRKESYLAPGIGEHDTAFLQYTSGSTGNPKGVILSHANLLANIRAMGDAVEIAPDDVVVSWLPLYHDMGLIGCWLSCLYYATPLVQLSPLDFLARPLRWLQAIHRYRGTLSPAPNFAYEFCLARLQEQDLEGLDLSSWRAAFNGAEAVSPRSLERFCTRFARCGFRRQAMMPVYGMAECSVGLAFPPLGREPVLDRIDRETFMSVGLAVPVGEEEENALTFVACAAPSSGTRSASSTRPATSCPNGKRGGCSFADPPPAAATTATRRRPGSCSKRTGSIRGIWATWPAATSTSPGAPRTW